MTAISASGVVAHLAPAAHQRVQSQLRNAQQGASPQSQRIDPMAAAHSKDGATAYRLQNHEPYHLGNAFADYDVLAEN